MTGFTAARFARYSPLVPLLLTHFLAVAIRAEPVPVNHPQGVVHGFLILRNLDGDLLASGDLLQSTSGPHVVSELTFHFKDGSLHEETAVYSQRRTFQLLTYHLVQKGPSFKHPLDFSFKTESGEATVREMDDNGKEKIIKDHQKLPNDLANGFVTTLLLNIDPSSPKTTVSMLVATPKPRLVKLEITPSAEDSFSIGGVSRKAISYDIRIDLGGIAGVVAPLIGKQPPDLRVWIIPGKAPGFLKMQGPLFEDGPIWKIEMASPTWPNSPN